MDILLTGQIIQYVLTGLTLGSVYAIVALGFNIIYNATEIINFAQGEFVMLGGLFMVTFVHSLGLPLPLAFPVAVAAVTLVGLMMERLAIYPLKTPGVLTLIIITIALSILVKGLAMFVWGKEPYSLRPFTGDEPIPFFGAVLMPQALWVIGVTLILVILLTFFFERTIIGKAMSACAYDREAASLVGINVRRMIMLSFMLSAALGAAGGILITPISLMEYDRGAMLALKGFGAAIVGGLGSFYGAVAGGFLLGLVESLGAGLIHSGYKDAMALVLLLLVLFVKPSGIFGQIEVSKIKKF